MSKKRFNRDNSITRHLAGGPNYYYFQDLENYMAIKTLLNLNLMLIKSRIKICAIKIIKFGKPIGICYTNSLESRKMLYR